MKEWKFALPAFKIDCEIKPGTQFQVDIIDTWNMTVTPADGVFEITDSDRYNYFAGNHPYVELPDKENMAIRIIKVH